LPRVLKKILEQETARVLDLGPLCGDTVVRLAGQGARVSVEVFEPPPPAPPRDPKRPAEKPPPPAPLKLDQPDGVFHLVLAWERVDFVPPERLADFGAEINRVLADGGFVLLFARNVSSEKDEDREWRRPGRFRLVDEDRLLRESGTDPERRRWVHPTREIERALAPLAIQGVHLQRNQMREFLARKTAR
jgi:hypothetical protein